MKSKDTEFVAVVPDSDQIEALYDLLKRREHTISHQELPSLEAHTAFVTEHPYRAWYLIRKQGGHIGSFYITNENTIGINIAEQESVDLVSDIIQMVKDHYDPLPAIKSVKAGVFSVNTSPSNAFLMNALREIGATQAQVSFIIP